MEGRFSVPRKRYHIKIIGILESSRQLPDDVLHRGERNPFGEECFEIRPAILAIDAIEGANFQIRRHEIDAQRPANPSRIDWTVDDASL